MKITLKTISLKGLGFGADKIVAQAMARGISLAVIRHLRHKNAIARHSKGFPKSNYYARAAQAVTTAAAGSTARVQIEHEGLALHYYGGIVYPRRGKALAIPLDPAAAGMWPSERGGEMSLVWPRKKRSGLLIDEKTGAAIYRLVPRAPVKADKGVLPPEPRLERAAAAAAEDCLAAERAET